MRGKQTQLQINANELSNCRCKVPDLVDHCAVIVQLFCHSDSFARHDLNRFVLLIWCSMRLRP